jgi:hypothetical protein
MIIKNILIYRFTVNGKLDDLKNNWWEDSKIGYSKILKNAI